MDYWELIGDSPAGGAEAEINQLSNPDVQLDKRHLMIRGENCSKVNVCAGVVAVKSCISFNQTRDHHYLSYYLSFLFFLQ